MSTTSQSYDQHMVYQLSPHGWLQVVEISARYDDACYPGTVTNAERERLLMQVCLCCWLQTGMRNLA